MPPRDRGTARRQSIVEAAAKLFQQRGFQGTSMDDVAAAAALNKSSLYHYFPSKAELLAQIYSECIDTMQTLYQAQDPALEPVERVRRIILNMVQALERRPHHMRVYVQEMQWLEKWLPSHQAAHLRKRETELWDFLATSISAGINTRTFVQVDPFLTGMALMGMVAWMPHWHPGGSRKTGPEVAEEYAALVLNGLLQRQPVGDGDSATAS